MAGAEKVRPGQRPCDEGVVVQHLLEVRHQPARIDGVAVKAAAGVVADASDRHAGEGVHRHGDAVRIGAAGPQEKVQEVGLGELGRVAESAVRGVEGPTGRRNRVAEELAVGGVEVARGGLGLRGAAGQNIRELGTRAGHVVTPRPVGVGGGGENLPEGRHAVPGLWGKVGAAVVGDACGGEERGERPSALSGHRLDRAHVDGVDVRPFLPVHLDVDEGRVHEPCGLDVLEGLPLHDMAPVTRRIADREEDGTVLLPGQGERLVTPCVPVHGVVRVLQQVGTGLGGEVGWA